LKEGIAMREEYEYSIMKNGREQNLLVERMRFTLSFTYSKIMLEGARNV